MSITLPCLLKSVFKSAARVDADKPLTHRFLLAALLLLGLCSSTNEAHTTYITGKRQRNTRTPKYIGNSTQILLICLHSQHSPRFLEGSFQPST